jgi:acetyl-CoA carboxylase biotin carboxyl carrier protein
MTDPEQALDAIERAAAELLPQLRERLVRYGLGEIEVRSGELRMRIAGTVPTPGSPVVAPSGLLTEPAVLEPAAETRESVATGHGVSSPAVGFFVYGDGLGPGIAVEKGDALGYVEMLGVRHEVRAPRRGTVRNLVAESGEPVEYGQVVMELEPAAAER